MVRNRQADSCDRYWLFMGECGRCRTREKIGAVRVQRDTDRRAAANEVLRTYTAHRCPFCGAWNTFGPRDLIVIASGTDKWPAPTDETL
jgi:hypothetical protein